MGAWQRLMPGHFEDLIEDWSTSVQGIAAWVVVCNTAESEWTEIARHLLGRHLGGAACGGGRASGRRGGDGLAARSAGRNGHERERSHQHTLSSGLIGMKIFWAWQSDTPGQIGRFFVRRALKEAIERIQSEADVTEPTEREAVTKMNLDHDRKGIPGSPDLAQTIFKKIDESSVVVADVTPVGQIAADGSDRSRLKRFINSNVAIEIGYALRSLGDRALLMVMNRHYGDYNDLPFDVAHKAGPLMFNLAPDADKATIESAAKKLSAEFANAIKLCVAGEAEKRRAQTPFPAAQPTDNRAMFFKQGTILASGGEPGEQDFIFKSDRVAYMRIHPAGGATRVGRAKITDAFNSRIPVAMNQLVNGLVVRENKFGTIIFDYDGGNSITALTQGFETGELWGMNGKLFRTASVQSPTRNGVILATALHMVVFEQIYGRVLRNYIHVQSKLGLPPPYSVILGVVGLGGAYLTVPNLRSHGTGSNKGPIYDNEIEKHFMLNKTDDTEINTVLREFFEQIYDMASIRRKDVWTADLAAAHTVPSLG